MEIVFHSCPHCSQMQSRAIVVTVSIIDPRPRFEIDYPEGYRQNEQREGEQEPVAGMEPSSSHGRNHTSNQRKMVATRTA